MGFTGSTGVAFVVGSAAGAGAEACSAVAEVVDTAFSAAGAVDGKVSVEAMLGG